MIRNRWFILLLAVLLALPTVSFGEAVPTVASGKGMLVSTEEELQPEAERLSFYVRFEVTGHSEIPEKLIEQQKDTRASGMASGGFSTSGAWGGGTGARATPRTQSARSNDITIGKPLVSAADRAANRTAAATFSAGDRVKHPVFGGGVILSTRPLGADVLLEVAFDRVGTKKLMATYAKLSKE